MAHASNTVIINRPADTVYAFLADGLNNPEWRDGVVSIELKFGVPGSVGAEYGQVLKGPGGRKIDGDYKVTAADPGQQVAFAVTTGPARPTGRYQLSAVDRGATELTFTLDYPTKGFKRLMDGMITKTMRSEVAALSKLKEVLEAS